MVGIDYSCRIEQIHFLIHIVQTNQIFKVVIGYGVAMLTLCAPENNVGQRISGCLNFISTVDKVMGMLCCIH